MSDKRANETIMLTGTSRLYVTDTTDSFMGIRYTFLSGIWYSSTYFVVVGCEEERGGERNRLTLIQNTGDAQISQEQVPKPH